MPSGADGGARARPPIARIACAASFALSTLLAARLAGEDARYLAAAVAFAAAGSLCALLAGRQFGGPALAVAALNLVLAVPELGLRSAGFQHVSGIQFGFPEPEQFWELELDRELFWKLPHAPPLTNSLGFFGPEPARIVPAGALRLLVLGDSCAQQRYPLAWPELAAARITERTGRAIDEVNLALAGYSSHQGRVLAERHARELAPDLVLVAYGWNDHWLARGATDADKEVDLRFERLYRRSRLLQLARRALGSLGWSRPAPVLGSNRVPLESYRENLRRIVATLREAGAAVVLLTAPSAHDLALPPYLVEKRFVARAEDAVEQHRAYNDVVREVARESGAELVDLEAELSSAPGRSALFQPDGIHFTEAGRAAVAEIVAERASRLPLFR
jgi:lysophospholipase L1-like esterase